MKLNVKLNMPNLAALRWLRGLTLPALLHIAGWVLIATLLACIVAATGIFYLYGLGYAAPPQIPSSTATVRLKEDIIRNAAAKIETRRQKFGTSANTASSSTPAKQ